MPRATSSRSTMSSTNGTPRATTPRSIRRDRKILDWSPKCSAPVRRGVFVYGLHRRSIRLTSALPCGHLLAQRMYDVIASEREAIHAMDKGLDCFVALLLAMMGWTAPDGINVPDW